MTNSFRSFVNLELFSMALPPSLARFSADPRLLITYVWFITLVSLLSLHTFK